MLQTIHDKITGWIAGLVIALIGIPFIFWGIDVGFGNVSYAARVKGHEAPFWRMATKIPLQDVNRTYQNQLSQYQQALRGEVPAEMKTELQTQLMDAYVRRELLEQHANEQGYRVREEDVDRSIQQIEQFQLDGKFNEEVAKRALQTQCISTAGFREQQRRDLQVAQVQAAIAASSFITPAELERAHALQNQEREVAWAVIDPATMLAGINPDEKAITAYYEANKQRFMTPETVTLSYVELKVGDFASQVKVDDNVLRAEYDQLKDRYVEAERRKGRHILINVKDGDEAGARKKADEILAKAKAPGADFSALAKQYSEDAGSAQQGGDLGWAERSFFVGPFSDALFAMQPDEVRGPVRSEFGYHIIRLDGIQTGKQKPFEEVRAELENEYRTAQAEKLFGEKQEIIAEKAFENIDSLDGVAASVNAKVQTIPGFQHAAGGGQFTNNAQVIEMAFAENVLNGQNSAPIEIEPGHILVLRSDDRKMPEQRPLATVRDQVVDLVKREAAEAQAKAKGEEALKKLNAGTPWSTVVAELKVPAEGPRFVTRTDTNVPPELRQAIFTAAKPTAGKPVYRGLGVENGSFGLIELVALRTASAQAAEERTTQSRQLAGALAQTEVGRYIEELHRKADVDTNPKAFE